MGKLRKYVRRLLVCMAIPLVYFLYVKAPRWMYSTVTMVAPRNTTQVQPPQYNITFLKDYKNPCWFGDGNNNALKCLPYFYMPGFGKCGTTDMRWKVGQHPLIYNRVKDMKNEYAIFEQCQGNLQCEATKYAKMYFNQSSRIISYSNSFEKIKKRTGYLMFTQNFPEEVKAILEKGQEQYKYPAIAGDGVSARARTSTWPGLNLKIQNVSGVRYLTVPWIKRVLPQTKIIVTMRDPVERSFSFFVYRNFLQGRKSSLKDFHDRSTKSVKRVNECFDSYTNPFDCPKMGQTMGVTGSVYHIFLKSWIDTFPSDQILVLRLEDYKKDMAKTIANIFKFLDLPPISEEAMKYIVDSETKNVTKDKRKLGDMWPETRKILTEFFKPHNEKLAKLLGDTRFLWNDVK